MNLLKDSDREFIKREFDGLSGPVKIINFTQEHECDYCRETAIIISEVAELSNKISVESYDFVKDKNIADKYGVDKIPATIITGGDDGRIKFYGMPSGYEFVTFLEDIKMVSSGKSGLGQQTKDILGKLKKPVHLQVFVTPT